MQNNDVELMAKKLVSLYLGKTIGRVSKYSNVEAIREETGLESSDINMEALR